MTMGRLRERRPEVVGKSFDGGRTFHIQQPVNDVPFNPCVIFTTAILYGLPSTIKPIGSSDSTLPTMTASAFAMRAGPGAGMAITPA